MEQTKCCDVLVIGAGVAGMRAAVAAQDNGARVILAVKGTIGASGASCYTVTEASGFGVADGRRCAEDSPDVHYADVMRAGHGMCDPEVVRTLVDEALGTVQELEAFGVEFEKENGDYLVSQGCFGSLPRNYNLRGHGTKIVRALRQTLNGNTQILENVMVTELLVQKGRCTGAVALTPEGDVTVIRAGAVILAGGGAGRLFRYSLNPKEMTGDSYALGYLAGAELMNMEFMQVGMGVLAPGTSILNSWIWSLHPEVTDRSGASVFPAVFPDGVSCEAAMFSLAGTEGSSSIFTAERRIELMKKTFYGQNGHLGFFTNSVERALFQLERRGFHVMEESVRRDASGRMQSAYLQESVNGFAVHVVRR